MSRWTFDAGRPLVVHRAQLPHRTPGTPGYFADEYLLRIAEQLKVLVREGRYFRVEKRYYSIESLEDELREFEGRFGMSSDTFFEIYRTDEVPAEIPGFEGFVWADTYQELCRLQGRETALPDRA